MANTQPIIQFSVENDVRTVAAMADALTPYVYENELYGTLGGSLPRLTIGGLLMRLQRLSALSSTLTPAQQQIVTRAQAQLDKVRQEWQVAYEGKIERELPSRIQSFGQLLKDCADDPRHCADAYPSEIEKRVIVQNLQTEAETRQTLTPDVARQLRNMDDQLRKYTQPADFIWDARLQAAYAKDAYWYLYVTIKR